MRHSSTVPTVAVAAQGGERLEQQRRLALRRGVAASTGRCARCTSQSAGRGRDGLEVPVAGAARQPPTSRPTLEAGEAVGAVAHEGELVGDRLGRHAELLPDAVGVVERPALAPVELHDLAADALAEVLVGRADEHLLDPVVGRRDRAAAPSASSASYSTIAHTVTPERVERLLEQRELRLQLRVDARARPCSRPRGRCGTTR